MSTVSQELFALDESICGNITELAEKYKEQSDLAARRGLLSQNLVSDARTLVDQVSLLIYKNDLNADSNWDELKAAKAHVGGRADLRFLTKFHSFLEISDSHYKLDGDGAQRVMLKYYEYFLRIRMYLADTYGLNIMANLESFPLDLDPALTQYHERIFEELRRLKAELPQSRSDNYYIRKIVPFFVSGRILYEVTFVPAVDWEGKHSRIIAFTDLDIMDNYATDLELVDGKIEVFGKQMDIKFIKSWRVNIRPCEFDHLAKILGVFDKKTVRGQKDYIPLMAYMTKYHATLVDIVGYSDERYQKMREGIIAAGGPSRLMALITRTRWHIRNGVVGSNVIRYLLLNMHNKTMKLQLPKLLEPSLDGVYLQKKTYAFEKMPLYASLPKHNPHLLDVLHAVGAKGRQHELLARSLRVNVEQQGQLYTPVSEIEHFTEYKQLIEIYNSKLVPAHSGRKIIVDRQHAFIKEYEDTTFDIVENLKSLTTSGDPNHTSDVNTWLATADHGIDDNYKREAMRSLFADSKVALIYGAAGTGKSRMIEHITSFFESFSKIYLANTNAAVQNLQSRVKTDSLFSTISSFLEMSPQNCDILFIDECSTVSNDLLLKVLQRTTFKYLVLVGDVYQIESIQFGNWFRIIRDLIPETSVFELTKTHRTEDTNLLRLWGVVRNREETIDEFLGRDRYSHLLDESVFDSVSDDEIILCLNYDGLYGINNINAFLQNRNPNPAVVWKNSVFKIGDRVLFSNLNLYKPLIYNNLKGVIKNVEIKSKAGEFHFIEFTVQLDRDPFTRQDAESIGLGFVDERTVTFQVADRKNNDDDDTDEHRSSVVPFQVAYAVSIHKAQGLEYESVKLIITNSNEDNISHNIFYTAITRTRKNLMIYWSHEVQRRIIESFKEMPSNRDLSIFKQRRLTP